jgi:hypothetical protein
MFPFSATVRASFSRKFSVLSLAAVSLAALSLSALSLAAVGCKAGPAPDAGFIENCAKTTSFHSMQCGSKRG